MVYATNSSAVDTVICRGKILMENRYVEGEEAILAHVRRLAREIVER